jgi:two-component system, cell cycle sensor histidine kinase and response regulator CckA
MTQQTMSQVFAFFYNQNSQAKATVCGFASSTALCSRAAARSWGSRLGEGAYCRLCVPVVMEEVCPEAAIPEPKSLADRRTILLVEDEPSLRAILSTYMREHGYRVYEAGNAREASQVCSERDIDLMITDLVMPGASGSVLASSLTAAHPSMPVIFMSGYADHAALEDALAQPCALFLQKPFRFAELLGKVRQALGRSPESHGIATESP